MLWAWIKGLFAAKARDEDSEPWDLYRPEERRIYRYFDGKEVIAADPMVIYKRMAAVGPELANWIKVARSPSKDARMAHEEVIKHIQGIFNVKSYDQGGLTEPEMGDLLDHFIVYLTRVKKNLNPSATTAAATSPSTQPGEPQPESPPATPSSSDSGSTATASSTAKPT